MQQVDFFTGEVVQEPTSLVTPEEKTAEQFAQFGTYHYGGPPPTPMVSPGAYGYYGQQPISYGYGGGYPNPYQQQQQYQYQPPYQPGLGNPAFQYMRQHQINQPMNQPQQDVTITMKPVNFGGSEFLPPMDYEETIEQMRREFWYDTQERKAKETVDNIARQQAGYQYGQQYGMNYYGNPYYANPWTCNNYVPADIRSALQEMEDNARQARIDLNMHLSRLAHNYLNHEIDEEKLREVYTGKTITIPAAQVTQMQEINKFENLVPFDNSYMYRQHHGRVSAEFNKYISKDANMNECFENMGLVWMNWELEDERSRRRREIKESYDSNSYRYMIQKHMMEKYAKERGVDLNGNPTDIDFRQTANQIKKNILASGLFPTLSQSATLADDGTLHITYNGNVNYGDQVIEDMNEKEYLERRKRFVDTIYGTMHDGG